MDGLMLSWPLTVNRILEHAERWHGNREVISVGADGGIVRKTYAQCADRARRLSAALSDRGVRTGDRVATLAWNTGEHFEAWYAIMCIGAVCHTLNPRMDAPNLTRIAEHAGTRLLLVDPSLLPLAQAMHAACPTIEEIWVLGHSGDRTLNATDALIGEQQPAAWGGFGEEQAAGLCYTSGTAGDPKGVLYSHRANFLHTLMVIQPDVFGLRAIDTVLPIVPMFHANAWGLVFAAPAVGAKLVLPGRHLDGASLLRLIGEEKVSIAAAVPTVWQGLVDHADANGETLGPLARAVVGGAACLPSLLRRLADEHDLDVRHAWGMTEMSPLGTISAPTADTLALPEEARRAVEGAQGRPPLGVELRVETAGTPGSDAAGKLKIRGFAMIERYYGDSAPAGDDGGWFDTGDVARIDAHGFMHITDREKDVVKSGGEWISSQELEALAAEHCDVVHAAVVAADSKQWGERPLLIVQLLPGACCSDEDLLAQIAGSVPRWWLPDAVVRVDAMPLGLTGKIDKRALRDTYRDHLGSGA
ncbi:MAG: AMP-binding protein [Sphingopyxis sp.]|nr:AMP-binding protein [Sphingopyxis sp.]